MVAVKGMCENGGALGQVVWSSRPTRFYTLITPASYCFFHAVNSRERYLRRGQLLLQGAYAHPTPARTSPPHAPTVTLPLRASSAPRPSTGSPWLRLLDPRPSLGLPPLPSVAMRRGPYRPRGESLSSPSLAAELFHFLCSAICLHSS